MFTGLVQAIGVVERCLERQGDVSLSIRCPQLLAGVVLGDSIATNGVCLTVTSLSESAFTADVSRETLAHSTLADLSAGDRVHLEKALTLSTPLGGHLVSGHVDGVGEIVKVQTDARSIRISIAAPDGLLKYIATKGSIAVDGVSLTVNRVDGAAFELNIVPHTAEQTLISDYQRGDKVNLEVDLIARYAERLLQTSTDSKPGLSKALLAEQGYFRGKH